ncbi:MAG: transposase [Spirochaetes bacterium]|nr:transposase [Spirochaetota bacterium]
MNREKRYFTPDDFHLDESGTMICPAGQAMWLRCGSCRSSDGKHTGKAYMGHVESCSGCQLRSRCMRNEGTKARRVVILEAVRKGIACNYSALMRERFDTPQGRSVHSGRMGTVEPVFGHIAGTKKLNRFTLRGRNKVNNQWLLYCMVHNSGKIQEYGKWDRWEGKIIMRFSRNGLNPRVQAGDSWNPKDLEVFLIQGDTGIEQKGRYTRMSCRKPGMIRNFE